MSDRGGVGLSSAMSSNIEVYRAGIRRFVDGDGLICYHYIYTNISSIPTGGISI